MGWSTPIGIWVGAIGTLALFSLIYRENRIYRIFEHIFVGLAGGFLIKITWSEVLQPLWWKPIVRDGQWPWVFALGLGLMYYTIYSRKYSWMSRLSIGVLFGLVAGQIFKSTANDLVPQIRTTFRPLYVSSMPAGSSITPLGQSLTNILFVVIVLTVMVYFFFSFEQKNKTVVKTARVGRLMLMVAFGAIFGSTVMARMALLIDRVWFLMHNWLKVA